jgi:hypothetical protein
MRRVIGCARGARALVVATAVLAGGIGGAEMLVTAATCVLCGCFHETFCN